MQYKVRVPYNTRRLVHVSFALIKEMNSCLNHPSYLAHYLEVLRIFGSLWITVIVKYLIPSEFLGTLKRT